MKSATVASRRIRLAGGIFAFLIWATGTVAFAQTRSISGVVETDDGRRLPGVDVRITNVGKGPTNDAGEFTLNLPSQFEPGSEIEFYVEGWVIINPYQGREFVPKNSTATIHIVVVRDADTRYRRLHPSTLQPKTSPRVNKPKQ